MAKINTIALKIPNLGEAESTEIIEVNIKVGDKVNVNDPLIVLESEKAAMEVPSDFQGEISEILIKEGDSVHEGMEFAKIKAETEVKEAEVKEEKEKDAKQGDEVAIGISGAVKKPGDDSSEATHVTVGRQINEGDVLLVDVPESHVRILRKRSLTEVEKEILDEIVAMHRKDPKTPRWGL